MPNQPKTAKASVHSRVRGFTFVELMIALGVVILVMAFAMPNLNGILEYNRFSSVIDRLETFAITAHTEAFRRNRPYQIRFHQNSFEIGPVPTGFSDFSADRTYTFPEGMTLEIQPWPSTAWKACDEQVWLFYPTGMCQPFSVRITKDLNWMEASFHPLTAQTSDRKYEIH